LKYQRVSWIEKSCLYNADLSSEKQIVTAFIELSLKYNFQFQIFKNAAC